MRVGVCEGSCKIARLQDCKIRIGFIAVCVRPSNPVVKRVRTERYGYSVKPCVLYGGPSAGL